MKFWDKASRTNKRLATVAGIILSLGVIGALTGKGIQKLNEYTNVPILVAEISLEVQIKFDSLANENALMWAIVQEFYDNQKDFRFQTKMYWNILMANTDKHDNNNYFITFDDGKKILAFIRDDHLRTPEQWVFFTITESAISINGEMVDIEHQHLFKAEWSGVFNSFYYVGSDGKDRKIYKE